MDQELSVVIFLQFLVDNLGSDASVDVTLARPDLHLTTRLLHHVGSEKDVGEE